MSNLRPTPEPIGEAGFYGVAGEILELISRHSEADPAALLAHVLAAAGNIIGRNAWYEVGGQRHHANLFMAMVGQTSVGRKGTAKADAFHAFAGVDDYWLNERQLGGLSSGEGLIWAVRDPVKGFDRDRKSGELKEVVIDNGIGDKRLLIVESEFASVLRRMAKDSNTLSPILRQAWDGGKLQTMTKASPATSTDAHISLIAHITSDELRRDMSAVESFNGFVNRICWFVVNRSKLLPDGGELNTEDFGSVRKHLRRVNEYANAGSLGKMQRDERAKELWHEIYPSLTADQPGALGAAAARAAAQVMRLSIVYAVMDLSAIIRLEHLQAALEVWRYCQDSIDCIFNATTTDKYLEHIILQGGYISVRDFQKRFWREFPTAEQAKAKLVEYAKAGKGEWEPPTPSPVGGRPQEIFVATCESVDSGQNPYGVPKSGVLSTGSAWGMADERKPSAGDIEFCRTAGGTK